MAIANNNHGNFKTVMAITYGNLGNFGVLYEMQLRPDNYPSE